MVAIDEQAVGEIDARVGETADREHEKVTRARVMVQRASGEHSDVDEIACDTGNDDHRDYRSCHLDTDLPKLIGHAIVRLLIH